jgi:hypothetical protein
MKHAAIMAAVVCGGAFVGAREARAEGSASDIYGETKGETEKKETSEANETRQTHEETQSDRAARIPPDRAPLPATAAAQAPFIGKGKFVLDDIIGIGTSPPLGASALSTLGIVRGIVGYSSANGGDGMGANATTHSIWLSPSGDYFLSPHISLGARVAATFSDAQSTGIAERTYGGSLVPRIGFFSPIGQSTGFWIRGGLGGGMQTSEQTTTAVNVGTLGGASAGGLGGVGGTSGTSTLGGAGGTVSSTSSTLHYWTAQADASYLVELTAHILVAAGPEAGYMYYATDGNAGASGARFNFGGRVSLAAAF